jgi:hypothetical protein
MIRTLAVLVGTALTATVLTATALAAPPTTTQAADSQLTSQTISKRLRAAVKDLPVRAETRAGYDRDKFEHWIDADSDCRDTRDEVLAQESRVRVTGSCDVVEGEWMSYYDKLTWRQSSDVDIDHMVPLAAAWDSGAKRWNAGTRRRFANDLGDRRALVVVTDNVNSSKGDRDPAEWLPPHHKCLYVEQYTAVKMRWALRVNRPEKRALTRVASGCQNSIIKVRRAPIRTGPGSAETDPWVGLSGS